MRIHFKFNQLLGLPAPDQTFNWLLAGLALYGVYFAWTKMRGLLKYVVMGVLLGIAWERIEDSGLIEGV